ncbi:MAG: hypothetical protein R3Y07_08515, partial [Eubacteriales bacterium]
MRRLTHLLLALTMSIMLCIAPLSVGASTSLFFTAINDSLIPLSSSTMPTWVGGVLYVPITHFDRSTTGISLGVNYSYNTSEQTASLYVLSKMMVFRLSDGTVYDHHTQESLGYTSLMRNGRLYVPVAQVCRYFDLTYSVNNTAYGSILRIRSGDAVLSDAIFMDASSGLMSSWSNEYFQSQLPSTPSPTTPPTVVNPEDPLPETQIFLGITNLEGRTLYSVLETLKNEGLYALFFFTPQQMREDPEGVRTVLGEGHFIGISLGEQPLADFEEGNLYLGQIAHTYATYVLSSNTLTEEGLIPYPTQVQSFHSL